VLHVLVAHPPLGIDVEARDLGVKSRSGVAWSDTAEVHSERLLEPFAVVGGEPEVRFQASVDAGVGIVVDGHAVRFLARESGEDSLFGIHRRRLRAGFYRDRTVHERFDATKL